MLRFCVDRSPDLCRHPRRRRVTVTASVRWTPADRKLRHCRQRRECWSCKGSARELVTWVIWCLRASHRARHNCRGWCHSIVLCGVLQPFYCARVPRSTALRLLRESADEWLAVPTLRRWRNTLVRDASQTTCQDARAATFLVVRLVMSLTSLMTLFSLSQ